MPMVQYINDCLSAKLFLEEYLLSFFFFNHTGNLLTNIFGEPNLVECFSDPSGKNYIENGITAKEPTDTIILRT